MMARIWLAPLLGTGAFLVGCNANDTTVPAEPIRPVLSMVSEPALTPNALIVGTIQPRFQTDLGFRALGRLIARPVHVGDRVSPGQAVAAIDPAALELAVRSAAAEVSNSQAQLTNATGIEGRQRTLLETDATTRVTLETAEQARAAAQASVVRAQANLTKAREQLGYAQLKADFAGVVTAIGAEVGQVVSPGQTVVTIARPDIREAVIDVGEDITNGLRIGTSFTVRLQLDPSVTANGTVREIAPRADTATRTRRIRITLDDPPEAFRLGTTVITTLSTGQDKVMRLPGSAILDRDGKTFVWRVDPSNGAVSLREVQGTRSEDGTLNVTAGLEAGTRVVTAGVHSLREDQVVRIDQEPEH
jgi:RND family efflux transporter MFP subunit